MNRETSVLLDALLWCGDGLLTQQQIADALGVSRSAVQRRGKALADGAEPLFREAAPASGEADRLHLLKESRDLLSESMREVTGTARANVVKELRAVLDEIDALEGEPEGADPLAEIVARHRCGG